MKRNRGIAAAAVLASVPIACVTAAPPDPPDPLLQGPTVVAESAMPTADGYLTEMPDGGTFIVPVRTDTPADPIFWSATFNYLPGTSGTDARGVLFNDHAAAAVDGGVTLISFDVLGSNISPFDPTRCAIINFSVAATAFYPPRIASQGVSSIEWHYTPGGPGNCDTFDAGDGAFGDAPADVHITPDAANP